MLKSGGHKVSPPCGGGTFTRHSDSASPLAVSSCPFHPITMMDDDDDSCCEPRGSSDAGCSVRTDGPPLKMLTRNRQTEPAGPTEGKQKGFCGGRQRAKRSKRSEIAMRAGTTLHVEHFPNNAESGATPPHLSKNGKLAVTLPPALAIDSAVPPTESECLAVPAASGVDSSGGLS